MRSKRHNFRYTNIGGIEHVYANCAGADDRNAFTDERGDPRSTAAHGMRAVGPILKMTRLVWHY